jgi:hypothetical protein
MIKEHSQALVSHLSYSTLPRQVVICLVYFAVLWLNSLAAAAEVSEIDSPCNIVLGHELNFTKHCIAPFGSYVKAHKDPKITNTMCLCTFLGIFLDPTGTIRGPTRSLTLVLVQLRNLAQSPSYPCQIGLSRWLMIGVDITQRRISNFLSHF